MTHPRLTDDALRRDADALRRLEEWLASSDLHLAKMSQEQGNAEPPPGWIVQLERDALCGETDVAATARGLDLAAAIVAALVKAGAKHSDSTPEPH